MDSDAAKFITVVVLPTPPFWLITASVVRLVIRINFHQNYF